MYVLNQIRKYDVIFAHFINNITKRLFNSQYIAEILAHIILSQIN